MEKSRKMIQGALLVRPDNDDDNNIDNSHHFCYYHWLGPTKAGDLWAYMRTKSKTIRKATIARRAEAAENQRMAKSKYYSLIFHLFVNNLSLVS